MNESADHERLLERTVFIGGVYRPFGELTPEEASARAAELREVSGWGPTMRVAPVALAWRELASEMERTGAGTVSQLDPQLLAPLARRTWVLMSDDPIMH